MSSEFTSGNMTRNSIPIIVSLLVLVYIQLAQVLVLVLEVACFFIDLVACDGSCLCLFGICNRTCLFVLVDASDSSVCPFVFLCLRVCPWSCLMSWDLDLWISLSLFMTWLSSCLSLPDLFNHLYLLTWELLLFVLPSLWINLGFTCFSFVFI